MRYMTLDPYPKEAPSISVKRYLKEFGYTEHQIRHIKFLEKGFLKNGEPCRVVDLLQPGDQISIPMEDAQMGPIPWEVLYEDSEVLVLDKPAGLVMHPAHGHYETSIVSQLDDTVRIVGRLDQDTSGVLMIAKNAIAAQRLQKQRWEGHMVRTYLAWVHGVPDPSVGMIRKPMSQVAGAINRMKIDMETGMEAVTHYEVLETQHGISKVRLHIETGRTHQIRLHMASIGHPLVADPIYGRGAELGLERTALHAWKLQWKHPYTGETLQVCAKIPEDLRKAIQE